MSTNINLGSTELGEQKTISGRPALIFSVLLLVFVFGSLFALAFLKNRYIAEKQVMTEQIAALETQLAGEGFSEVIEFQTKLNLLDKAVDDHAYWDSLLVNMGSYVIPEVRFEQLSGKVDLSGMGELEISGLGPNFDAVSRELILIKGFPNLRSLEFKNAEQSDDIFDQANGVKFNANLKVNKPAFQK